MRNIAMQQITVDFGAVRALDAVNLDFQPGVTLLAGPNGAGKSTLIKVLLGLVRCSTGRLAIDEKLARVDNGFKERLGYLPEAVAFAENLTGRQVLRFFARARGISKQRVEDVLTQIGLEHAARRRVRGYSKGMRQRLGLGVAILAEPELLILDEPTGGLDQQGLSVLWAVLEEWRQKQRIVVVTSHDLTLMEQRVDRICLLKEGRLAALGSPEELRIQAELPIRVNFQLNPGHHSVHLLIKDIEQWDRVCSLRHCDKNLTVEIPPDDLLVLMDLRNRNAEAVVRLRVEEPGLDDVYETLLREVA